MTGRRPTWGDYATHDSSAYPELWNGCVFAAAPCLGPTGKQLIDVVGGRRGTFTNMDVTTDWVVSSGQYAIDFDGTDDQVTFGALGLGLLNATITAWVKNRGSSSGGRFVDCDYADGFWLGVNAISADATSWGGGFLATGSPYGSYGTAIANEWNHVALVRTGTTCRTYINGSSASSSNYTGGSGTTQALNVLYIGGGDTPGDCQVDDVRIYNRPLSEAEMRLLSIGRGVSYFPRNRKKYFLYPPVDAGVTGTAAITLSNFTASASGNTGTGLSGGFRLSQATSFPLSDSLSIG